MSEVFIAKHRQDGATEEVLATLFWRPIPPRRVADSSGIHEQERVCEALDKDLGVADWKQRHALDSLPFDIDALLFNDATGHVEALMECKTYRMVLTRSGLTKPKRFPFHEITYPYFRMAEEKGIPLFFGILYRAPGVAPPLAMKELEEAQPGAYEVHVFDRQGFDYEEDRIWVREGSQPQFNWVPGGVGDEAGQTGDRP